MAEISVAANNLLRPEVGDKVPDPDPSQSAGRCRPQLGDDESGRLIADLHSKRLLRTGAQQSSM